MADTNEPCPGCHGLFPVSDGPVHRYLGASAGCWAAYGEVLAKEYSDPRYRSVHRLTVDAYSVQHPGRPSPQTVQSLCLHLIGLHLAFEKALPQERITRAMSRMAKRPDYLWLEPQPLAYAMTVLDVTAARDAAEHAQRVREWARAAWAAWSDHHAIVEAWAGKYS